ncbi:MAG: ATP:cob(I)alamin adenosyltransferase [Ignavibacteria bacterium RBG_16_34_14]|nr:MAG: ATP:cob(I)alamin adenosyltransferase [Ignavibacteria bacterium RBG_16_34_14]
MKIYTKGGDKGETGLFGGERVPKDSLRIEAYGTVDELNSFIGLTLTEIKDSEVIRLLNRIQNILFTLGSDLAAPENENKTYNIPRITKNHFEEIEKEIDKFDIRLNELRNFILPGGCKSSALLHICRTICRRAERRVVTLSNGVNLNPEIIIFLNRLSDLFFVLARYENKVSGIEDVKWQP